MSFVLIGAFTPDKDERRFADANCSSAVATAAMNRIVMKVIHHGMQRCGARDVLQRLGWRML
jgi:hypothetical protein